MEAVRKLNMETLIYYIFHVVWGTPIGIILLTVDPDKSLETCNWIYRGAHAFILLSNFVLYRLLLMKATLYDPMLRMQRLAKMTWIAIHAIYLPLLLYGIFSAWYWSRKILLVEGNDTCVEWHTTFAISFFISVDALISCCCVVILAGPTYLAQSSEEIKHVVIRNSIAGLCAAVSTFLMNLYFLNASQNVDRPDDGPGNRFIVVSIAMRLGSFNALANLTSVCLSWPLGFYRKVLQDHTSYLWSQLQDAISGVNSGGDESGIPMRSENKSSGDNKSNLTPNMEEWSSGKRLSTPVRKGLIRSSVVAHRT